MHDVMMARLRNILAQRDIEAVTPMARRNPQISHDCQAYRQRNLIERMFARLKDFRRVATRYDKLANNFRWRPRRNRNLEVH
jgi:transposase